MGAGTPAPDLSRPGLEVAPLLLGCVLRVGDVAARLVEVEAYEGERDPASHAWKGPSRRNAVMFGGPGHLYVYAMHGHHCCNIACREEGVASAVLLRGAEIVDGLDAARARRPGVADTALARGPGNLCRALGITSADNGASLFGPRLLLSGRAAPVEVAAGPRVNVSRAGEWPWRFWVPGSPSVSAYKRHGGSA